MDSTKYRFGCRYVADNKTINHSYSRVYFLWQFSDFYQILGHFPDSYQIPWHFQVFQTSGHPEYNHKGRIWVSSHGLLVLSSMFARNVTYLRDLIEGNVSRSLEMMTGRSCSKRCVASRTNTKTSAAANSFWSLRNSINCKRTNISYIAELYSLSANIL